MLDSDDERENNIAGKVFKKKRPGRHCCDSVKSIDMYGVQPTLKINGRSKFHTWWGAFFSLLAIGSIGYYAYYKGLFYYFNKETYLVTNLILQNQETELGRKVQTLMENKVDVGLEVQVDPSYLPDSWSQQDYIGKVKEFLRYVEVNFETAEYDAITGE